MSRLRLCVLGAGSWVVKCHLPNLARRRDSVEFVGVCRTGAEELEYLRDDWGFEVASED
jgi:predicted dehydrogenase